MISNRVFQFELVVSVRGVNKNRIRLVVSQVYAKHMNVHWEMDGRGKLIVCWSEQNKQTTRE